MLTHPMSYRVAIFCLFLVAETIVYGQSKDMIFVSDTQAPMWVETLWLKSNHNQEATGFLFRDIVKQHPAYLFILGDVVTLGYKKKKWSRMDRYLDSCRQAGIRVSALLGNHDVMTRARKGESLFQQRFPDHHRTGFYQVVDSVAVLFLNSNFKKLAPADIQQQQEWLSTTLTALDEDPSILITVVACHHAPYSNSTIVGSSEPVQKYFVPSYLQSRKARLFITGHSHNYELFQRAGKDFLVIGGGGGLHQPLSEKPDRLFDLSSGYKPQFHYLVMQRNGGTLCLTSRYLLEDFSGFQEGLSFSIHYR